MTDNENTYNHLQFQCSSSVISGLPVFAGYDGIMKLETVYVVGISGSVNSIQVNSQRHANFTWSPALEVRFDLSQRVYFQSQLITMAKDGKV